jgi:flagellar motor switch protein FliN/FliY
MADTDNDGGMLSQADLDALIAAAQQQTEADPDEYALADDAPTPDEPPMGTLPMGGTAAGAVDLPPFDPPAGAAPALEIAPGLGRVRDIPLEVTVELGRTRLLIRDIMDLAPGSIIELDKIAGEPVDLYANGMLVARGEVIVIDDNFGVRVTEIITAADRQAGKDGHALAA